MRLCCLGYSSSLLVCLLWRESSRFERTMCECINITLCVINITLCVINITLCVINVQISDIDNDGILNDQELNDFQV